MLAFLLRSEPSLLFPLAPWDELPEEQLPPPPWREGLGAVHLPVTTAVPRAQAWFDQGLALLHLGWRGEARRAFAEAARCDPRLALAWWGLALTRGPGSRCAAARLEASHKALALSEGVSDAEQRYVVATTFLAQKGPASGRHGFVREMEGLIEHCPEDAEARLLLAGLLADGYEPDGRPAAGQGYAQLLVRELLRTHPEHPGVHLAWVRLREESARPEEALASARRLRELAPQVPPALLAAGRLFLRTGHTREAREVLALALSVEDAWRERESLPIAAGSCAGQALRLLVQACADAGRYGEAQSWARRLRTRAEEASPRVEQALVFAASALSALHLRFGFLRAAAETRVELSSEARPAERAWRSGLELYARGLRALEAGQCLEAERQCGALEALGPPLLEEGKTDGLCPRDVARVVELAACELRGALEARQGDSARAEATLVRAMRLERRLRPVGPPAFSRPARETLARVRSRFGRDDKALELAEALLSERPGQGHAWLHLAELHLARGAPPEATRALGACLQCWHEADAHLAEVQRARALLAGTSRPRHLRLAGDNAPA